MKLVTRIAFFVIAVLAILGGAAYTVYQQTASVWNGLLAVAVTAILLSVLVDEVLGFGVFLGKRRAERDMPSPEEQIAKMMAQMRERLGIPPGGEREDDDEDEHEKELARRMDDVANTLTDPDLKEFAFHFAHIAQDCPSSLEHAKRLHDLTTNIEARLRASSQAALTGDRPTMH